MRTSSKAAFLQNSSHDAARIHCHALTLVEVMVIVAVLGLLIALLLPSLAKPRARSSRINCDNNLKQIGLSFRIWAADNGDRYPMQVPVNEGGTLELVPLGNVFPHFQILSNELNTPKVLACPKDRSRKAAANFLAGFNNAHVSYFVGLDAEEARPQMLLAGDSNLEV